MGLLFLVILTLFLPSCAGANLRKLGVEAAAMNNSRALSAVSRHLANVLDLAELWPEALKNFDSTTVTFSADIDTISRDFEEVAKIAHDPRDIIVNNKKVELGLDPLWVRMEKSAYDKLSENGLLRLLLLEFEKGYRWNNDQILHKQSGTSMKLTRTKKEIAEIENRGGKSPLMTSSIGRHGQLVENGEKVMSFCIVLRHKDGGPLVRRVEGKEGLWFANKEDVEMVIISSSNQAKSNWITVKGGRNIGEQPEQAALRETLEECGFAVTIRKRLENKVVVKQPKKPGDKVEMSRWETWVMDGGEGQGIQYGKKEGEAVGKAYEMFSEDGRLRGLFAFDDAVALIKHSDPVMAANVMEVEELFGKRQDDKDAMLAGLKLELPEET
ncbi:unnamed protein product [Peronospora farinosa]|uniref:Nudix hydrolase domain-containing protein n=1 Tax=Peronospora farinosa TaxID=134698 RepID=A0ABN8C4K4_9STRA|nr:unnamed protein product [Peronospora farinosa]